MTLEINQLPVLPKKPLPIAIIGCGGIVNDAHIPAYIMAGFPVMGIFDINQEKAKALKERFPHVQNAYDSLDTMIAEAVKAGAIFDIAVPASFFLEILKKIPAGSTVLIQKPMGETLEEARAILQMCKEKRLISGVNFQLRYAPYMIAARQMIDQGLLGDVYDMELNLCVYTPWHLWDFLQKQPRMEILNHSVHYLDLIRSFLGTPWKIYASTIKHPKTPQFASTKTTMILDYNEFLQARVITNHGHDFGPKHQTSFFKIEGTKGAIKIQIGLSLDYPKGRPSKFEYYLHDQTTEWQEMPLRGDWFPEAFMGTMAGLQNHCINPDIPLLHSTEDAYETMKLVEAAYDSNDNGGTLFSSIK